MAGFNLIGSIFQPETRMNYAPAQYSSKANSSKWAQKGKLSKSDIGTPDNFKHITHIGFSSLSGLDLDSDVDMKALVSPAGVKEESLKDKKLPHVIFDALKTEGSLKLVHKIKRRKSVARPNACTKQSSLSSPGDAICNRLKRSTEQSPLTAKIANALPDNTPLNYIQSLREIPSPSSDFSSNLFQSKRHPPYLKELSQAFSSNPSDPQLLYRRPFENMTPHPPSMNNKEPPAVASYSIHSNSTMKKYFLKPPHPCSSISSNEEDLSSIPNHESSLIKLDLPPVSPSFAKGVNLEIIMPSHLSSGPPPAPALPFKLQSGSNQSSNDHFLYEHMDMPLKSQVGYLNSEELSPSKLLGQQNEQTFFLDQIRQGVQLKSVSQKLKDEMPECSSIVGALRAVIQRRHKVIHSSDDEEDDNLDWED